MKDFYAFFIEEAEHGWVLSVYVVNISLGKTKKVAYFVFSSAEPLYAELGKYIKISSKLNLIERITGKHKANPLESIQDVRRL